MKGLSAITRRELAGLFFQPLAWVLLCLALLVHGLFMALILKQTGGDVRTTLISALGAGSFWLLTLLLAPLLTMRMISEESRSGLLEFLLTAPVSDLAVVLGKQLAATAFFAILWTSTLLFAIGASLLGAEVDWGQLLVGYGGALLVSFPVLFDRLVRFRAHPNPGVGSLSGVLDRTDHGHVARRVEHLLDSSLGAG